MKPTPVALGLVRLSTRLLPAGDLRQRYRWELFADLSALDRSHQLAYASGVFSTAWQLRRELTQEIDPMNDTTDRTALPLLCRLNLRHHWHYVTNPEDNHRFRPCARCGKDDPRLGQLRVPSGLTYGRASAPPVKPSSSVTSRTYLVRRRKRRGRPVSAVDLGEHQPRLVERRPRRPSCRRTGPASASWSARLPAA